MQIDHFVFGINDLERGTEELEARIGIRASIGGEHPAFGTHNALVSLGGRQYLEIVAPRPGSALGRSFAALETLGSLTPVAWAVATDEIEEVRERLIGLDLEVDEVIPGSRRRPDGSVLTWKLLSLLDERVPTAPFFIEWGEGTPHPGTSPPPFGCSVESFGLVDPHPDLLQAILDELRIDVPVTQGDVTDLRLSVRSATGVTEFGWVGGGGVPTIRFLV